MKKLFLIIAVLFLSIMVSGQISSDKLIKERNKEVKKIEKMNIHPDDKIEEVKKVDDFYGPLIERAMERESTPTKQETTKSTREARNPIGSNISYNGDQGNYSARTISARNGAESYAIVAQADANAYLTRKVADGNSNNAKIAAPNMSVGLEGVVINKYTYQELEVRIVGINPGNTYQKVFLLGRGQSITDYLLPGVYEGSVKATNQRTPTIIRFTVEPHRTHNVNGRDVFWGLWGGSSW